MVNPVTKDQIDEIRKESHMEIGVVEAQKIAEFKNLRAAISEAKINEDLRDILSKMTDFIRRVV